MPTNQGTDISLYKGETLRIEVNVYDSANVPMSNISFAKFAYKKGTVTVSDATVTIDGETISVEIEEADTLTMSGQYEYEFRIKDDTDDVDTVITGHITVMNSLFTTAMPVPTP
jgi:hypothetical protein